MAAKKMQTNSYRYFVWLVLLGMLLACAGVRPQGVHAAGELEAAFEPDADAKQYLEGLRGKTLTIGVTDESEYVENGRDAYGSAVPVVELLQYEFGLQVQVVRGSIREMRAALAEGDIDLLYGVPAQPLEEKEMSMLWLSDMPVYCTGWIQEEKLWLVAPKGSGLYQSLYAGGHVIGTVKGCLLSEVSVGALMPIGKVTTYETMAELLQAVRAGEAEAALVPDSRLWQLYGCGDLESVCVIPGTEGGVGIAAVNHDFKELLLLVNAYLVAGESGGLLRESVRQQSIRYFTEFLKQQESKMPEEIGRTLRFAFEGLEGDYDTADVCTDAQEMNDFMDFMALYTGVEFTKISVAPDRMARDLLEEDELDIVIGAVLTANITENYTASKVYKGVDMVPAVSPEKREKTEQSGIAHCYWGTTATTLITLTGTEFENCTIPFASEREMLEALRQGAIGGVLLRRNILDVLLLSGDELLYPMAGVGFPVQEVVLFRKDAAQLAELWNRLFDWYKLKYPDRDTTAVWLEQYCVEQQNEQQSSARGVSLWMGIAVLLMIVVIILAVLLYLVSARLHRKESRLRYQEQNRKQRDDFDYLDKHIERRLTNGPADTEKAQGLQKGQESSKAKDKEGQTEIDDVTGLPLVAACLKRMKHILEEYAGTQAVLAYMELEDLTEIENSYGYAAAQEMMISFAECLRTLEMDENTVVFRVSETQFGAFRGNMAAELDYRLYLGELQSLSAQIRSSGDLLVSRYRCGAAVCGKQCGTVLSLENNAKAALEYSRAHTLRFVIWQDGSMRT